MFESASPTGGAGEPDARFAAVIARDRAADGAFFYAVRTTGVYCRPSCAARPPRRENVVFYPTRDEAERAGYRPCKRCKPGEIPLAEQRAMRVAELCRFIEQSETPPSLEDLALHTGWSVFHTQRIFKAVTGLSPRAYADALRAREVRGALDEGRSVTDAVVGAGYGSSSRFYEKSTARLGMTPTRFRAGGAEEHIRFAVDTCSLGSILVAATDRGICAILLGEDPRALADDLAERFPRATRIAADPDFEALVARVVALVEQPGLSAKLPLDIRGTAFQERVWRALREIPAGETATYSDIAASIGSPKAVRAVAGACAANALAVAVPCHRVVRKDGDLSGYRWGIERKRQLLARESVPAAPPQPRGSRRK